MVYGLEVTGDGLYVGGDFGKAGGKTASGFTRWDGAAQLAIITAAAGGSFRSDDGVQITFPAGAVASDTTIRFVSQGRPAVSVPQNTITLGAFRFTATNAAGQPVTSFGKAYTLRVPYDPAHVSAPSKLQLAYWEGAKWVGMLPCAGCKVDAANNQIIVVADHFTDFAIFLQVDLDQQLYLPLVRR
ncbi:hypothetical protein HC891_17755 [Candidatus Gracilibacteria bacterium]|nr:hypothetical protein [Candidatus Gracilibacteria bacterium]